MEFRQAGQSVENIFETAILLPFLNTDNRNILTEKLATFLRSTIFFLRSEISTKGTQFLLKFHEQTTDKQNVGRKKISHKKTTQLYELHLNCFVRL